jgi:hypothetical protein
MLFIAILAKREIHPTFFGASYIAGKFTNYALPIPDSQFPIPKNQELRNSSK